MVGWSKVVALYDIKECVVVIVMVLPILIDVHKFVTVLIINVFRSPILDIK